MARKLQDPVDAEVRALAHRLNVDLSIVTPSGPGGAVTAQDVQRVHRVLAEVGPLEPLAGQRRALALSMAQAHAAVMHASVFDDAVLAAWRDPGQDLTLRLIRAIVAAVAKEPALNAWFDDGEIGRRVLSKVHLGITLDTPGGQFVAVMQDVGGRSEDSLRAGLERMKRDGAQGSLPAEELRGYTLTLSNFGICGGRYAAPAIVPPTVAVLSAGRAREDVVAIGGAPAVARVLPLSVTFDHRAVTAGEAARFLAAAIADLERPS